MAFFWEKAGFFGGISRVFLDEGAFPVFHGILPGWVWHSRGSAGPAHPEFPDFGVLVFLELRHSRIPEMPVLGHPQALEHP